MFDMCLNIQAHDLFFVTVNVQDQLTLRDQHPKLCNSVDVLEDTLKATHPIFFFFLRE